MLTLKYIWTEELPELLDTASCLTKILKLIFFFFISALQISWSRFLDTPGGTVVKIYLPMQEIQATQF